MYSPRNSSTGNHHRSLVHKRFVSTNRRRRWKIRVLGQNRVDLPLQIASGAPKRAYMYHLPRLWRDTTMNVCWTRSNESYVVWCTTLCFAKSTNKNGMRVYHNKVDICERDTIRLPLRKRNEFSILHHVKTYFKIFTSRIQCFYHCRNDDSLN